LDSDSVPFEHVHRFCKDYLSGKGNLIASKVLIDAFIDRNSRSEKIPVAIASPTLMLVSPEQSKSYDPSRYRGFGSFSLPAYSRDGSESLVYFTSWCGPLCAHATLYALTNNNGIWQVKDYYTCIVS